MATVGASRIVSCQPNERRKKVAIIGAGPGGLVCARECVREGLEVSVFEQGKEIGGSWNVDPVPADLKALNVLGTGWEDQAVRIFSSMYYSQRSNIPRELMGFQDFPFDELYGGCKDPRRYCPHHEVKRYLESFASHFDLNAVIELETKVVKVKPTQRAEMQWDVTVISKGNESVHRFDAVVVSNGKFTLPYVPEIDGIDAFEMLCLHSHLYRSAESYTNKTVVIHGNSYSAMDIAYEVGRVAKSVFVSGRKWKPEIDRSKPVGAHGNIHFVSNITECTGKGELRLEDGRVLKHIDVLLFCTGYRYAFPFLESSIELSINGKFVHPLYKRIFHPEHPTLAFTLLPEQVLPFVMAEIQSKLIARVFSGSSQLPEKGAMMTELNADIEDYKKEDNTLQSYNKMSATQWEYMDELAALCGDVGPLPCWRQKMWDNTVQELWVFPISFRDRDVAKDLFEEAHQEFALFRKLNFVREE